LSCWWILRRRIRRFWGVSVRSLRRRLRRADPILKDCLSCRTNGDEDDKCICVDLRILRHIRSKLVDGLSRVCFERRQQIRRIVVLKSLECLWVRRVNVTLWRRQLERISRSSADLVLERSLWLQISIDGGMILGSQVRLSCIWMFIDFSWLIHFEAGMTDSFWGRDDRGRTSQHPRDRSLPISTSQAFILSATSGVARASL